MTLISLQYIIFSPAPPFLPIFLPPASQFLPETTPSPTSPLSPLQPVISPFPSPPQFYLPSYQVSLSLFSSTVYLSLSDNQNRKKGFTKYGCCLTDCLGLQIQYIIHLSVSLKQNTLIDRSPYGRQRRDLNGGAVAAQTWGNKRTTV